MWRSSGLVLVVFTLLLAACTAPAQPSPGGAPSGSDQPKAGGTVNVRFTIDPFDWDLSYVGKSVSNREPIVMAYDSMLKYKAAPGVGYTERIIEPELAERWEVS